MAIIAVIYRCLRCGHETEGEHDTARGPQELTCPRCKSNSVRRIPRDKATK